MKKDTYVSLKEDFQSLKKYQLRCRKIQSLLKEENVKEFIDLASLDYNAFVTNYKVYSNDEIIKKIIFKYTNLIKRDDTNKLYVLINAFKILNGYTYFVNDDLPYDFKTYHNLEMFDDEVLPFHAIRVFEKNNNILVVPENILDRNTYYKKIQLEFFKELIKSDQESAKKLILEKYGR